MSEEIKNGLIIDEYGNKYWYKNNQVHRENGPAIEYISGSKIWYLNDNRHREDGPAADYVSGARYWYYHGKLLTCSSQEEFKKSIRLLKLKAFW